MISFSNIEVLESEGFEEPVIKEEAKLWLKVDFPDDDDLIETMITAARQDVEGLLNIKLVDSSVSIYVTSKCNDDLPVFPYAINLNAVDNLVIEKVVNGQPNEEIVLDTDYYFNGQLSILSEGRYKLEYDILADVPESIKEAIKMLVAYRYDNRGDQEKQQGIPEDILSKIHPYKQQWL